MNLSDKPKPKPVYFHGSFEPCGYACGVCGQLWDGNDSFAERCCPPHKCERECRGDARMSYSVYCKTHSEELDRKNLVEKMRRGKFVPAADWTGPVWDEPEEDFGWHKRVQDMMSKRGDKAPSWVWGCCVLQLGLDAEDILTTATENACCGDSAEDEAYAGQQDLQVALDAWCKAHPVRWWEPTGVVVVIDSDRFAKEFPELAP